MYVVWVVEDAKTQKPKRVFLSQKVAMMYAGPLDTVRPYSPVDLPGPTVPK